jgi:hypothetical protein
MQFSPREQLPLVEILFGISGTLLVEFESKFLDQKNGAIYGWVEIQHVVQIVRRMLMIMKELPFFELKMLIFLCLVILFFCFSIFKSTRESFLENTEPLKRLVDQLSPVFPEFKKIPVLFSDTKSFTINKQTIFICICDKTTQQIYTDDELIYVLLHELAHAVNVNDQGHTKKFWKIFHRLLSRAKQHGLYNDSEPPMSYCKFPYEEEKERKKAIRKGANFF